MADQNQQLADTVERLNSELRLYGELTQSTADAVNDARVGIKGFSAASRMGGAAIGKLGDAAGAAAGAMYEGKKGAAAFNDSVGKMGEAAEVAAAALALLIPGGPAIKLLVAGIGMAAAAYAKYTQAANKMSDELYSGFTKLSKSGAAASDGLSGVYKDITKLGMGMQDLDKYVEIINGNSKDLAMLGGTVFQGRKQFVEMGEAMQENRKSLMNLGLSQDEIAQGGMKYLSLQNRIGQAQGKTNAELAEGARKYLVEMDGLSKLTGQTRQEMEQQMEAARSEQRFRAKLDEMRANGQKAEADEMEKANLLISSRSKEAGQAFRDLSTGMVTTEAAQKGLIGSNGELLKQSQRIAAGQATAAEGATEALNAQAKFAKDNRALALTGTFNDIALDYAQSSEAGNYAAKDFTKSLAEIKAEQEKQGATGKEAADKLQAAQVNLRDEQIKATKATQDFVFKGTIPATNKMIELAKATRKAAEVMNLIAGVEGDEGVSEQTKAQDEANWEAATTGEKIQTGLTRGIEKAGFGIGKALSAVGLESAGQAVTGVAAQAQTTRVAEETAYLQGKGRAKIAAPVSGGSAPAGGGGQQVQSSQQQLSDSGLKLKKGDVQKEGATIDSRIIEMAKQIQSNLPGFAYFSGFNDNFHQEKAPGSQHAKGMAMDFALNKTPTPEEGAEIVKYLQSLGATLAIDEYNNPSSNATAGHIHAQISGYADGGLAETPQIAMVAEKGPEAMIPLQDGAIPVKLGLDNPVIDMLMGRAVPGYGKLEALPSSAEAMGPNSDLASKVLEIANMINPTIRVVAVLADSFKALTNLPKADNISADGTNSTATEIGQEFKSAMKEMQSMQTARTGDPEMLNLLTELIREQRNANDISSRILQVSAN